MDIGLLNEKITIEKAVLVKDEIGNHMNGWEEYFSCYATVGGAKNSGKSGAEDFDASQTNDVSVYSFTVRYCQALSDLDVMGYRVIFRGDIYDIIQVDYMNFRKKSIKIRAQKARR